MQHEMKTHLEIGFWQLFENSKVQKWARKCNEEGILDLSQPVFSVAHETQRHAEDDFMSGEPTQVFVFMFSAFLLTFIYVFRCEWPISGRRCKRAKCKRNLNSLFLWDSHPFNTRKSAMNASSKYGGKINVLYVHRHDSLRNCAINFKTLMHHN